MQIIYLGRHHTQAQTEREMEASTVKYKIILELTYRDMLGNTFEVV